MVTLGYLRLCSATFGYLRLHLRTVDYLRLVTMDDTPSVTLGYPRLPSVRFVYTPGYVRLPSATSRTDYPRLHLANFGNLFGYLRFLSATYGYPFGCLWSPFRRARGCARSCLLKHVPGTKIPGRRCCNTYQVLKYEVICTGGVVACMRGISSHYDNTKQQNK